jgi:mRNA interferase MazF
MKEGSIILTPMPQADGQSKNRPALVLRIMPRFNDALVCGVSTQLYQQVAGFDEIIFRQDDDYAESGLVAESLIWLGFLAIVPSRKLLGSIGSISSGRHQRLLNTLADYLSDRA